MEHIAQKTINIVYPDDYLTPTDKVTRSAFAGKLYGEEVKELAMERRGSKKHVTVFAHTQFDALETTTCLEGSDKLNAYDREVHDAISTLHFDGGTDYITPKMIYRVMTGNPKAFLSQTQRKAIQESIIKCMFTRIRINAEEEAEAYGFENIQYDGNLISGEIISATLSGTSVVCLHLLRPPILHYYADRKNQIGRFNIELLNSPIRKSQEVIVLQGYLHRRILSMKGTRKLSKVISYNTLYEYLDITASSDGALRKRKFKLRSQIKSILDYWTEKGFITSYRENKKGQSFSSISITI